MTVMAGATEQSDIADNSGYVRESVRTILRLEGLAVLAAAVTAYAQTGASWYLFGILFLSPDLSLLAYLGGSRAGAIAYNAVHSYLGPLALLAAAYFGNSYLLPYALIWIGHNGMDRAVGYGLKYASSFGDTHLGFVGKRR